MRLTTKARFAVTAMIHIAMRQHISPATVTSISEQQAISISYLEQLLCKLKRHKLVESVRGPGGGYTLGRDAELITVADIMVAVDVEMSTNDDVHDKEKNHCTGAPMGRCLTEDLWSMLNAKVVEFLDSVTLRNLVNEQYAKGVYIDEHPARLPHRKYDDHPPIGRHTQIPNSVFALGTIS
jgi:Rrf2 family transcriptional regulator, iron-sulfur cluster assembly transcription factor